MHRADAISPAKRQSRLGKREKPIYWLGLIRDSGVMSEERLAPLVQESLELKKILSATVRTSTQSEAESLTEH